MHAASCTAGGRSGAEGEADGDPSANFCQSDA
jgi:hypothetical protein